MLVESTSNIPAAFERLAKRIRWALPEGKSLPDDVWQSRHWGIRALLWLHVVGVVCFGLMVGAKLEHSLAEGAALAALAVTASWHNTPRRFRSSMASLGLITASAELVHLSGGYIEMHFHFFVMLAVIVLYQDWIPFLLALGYVIIHHGVIGVLDPGSVYNHADAFAHPWKWAAIHGGFVLAASIAGIVSWRLNEAIRAHNELILNSTGEGIIGVDLQNKITFINPAAARMIGYQVNELQGQPLYNLLHSSKIDSVVPVKNGISIQTLTQPEAAQAVVESLFWRKNGTSFLAEYISTPIREGGVVVGAVVAFKDITERKRAEEALQKAKDELEIRVAERTAELKEMNARLRFELAERRRAEEALAKRAAELEESRNFLDSIIESIPNILFIKDAEDLRFVRVNRACEELHGVDSQKMIGKDDYNFVSKEEADFFTAKDREVLAGGKLVDIPEESIHTASKGIRFLHTRKVPILGADRKPKYLLGISEDITERKQAEAALKDSEARYKAIATTVPGAIYQFTSRDDVWLVDYVAPQILELFGLKAEDVMRDLNNFVKHIYPDDLPGFVASVTEAVEKLTSWNFEGRLINPNTGELTWWQGMSTPVATSSGETIFNGILLNITARKRAEEALRQSEQRFRQVVSSISDHIYVTEVTEAGQHHNLYLSPHVEPLTGYPLDKFIADWSFWPSTVIHPDDRAAAAVQAARLAQGQNSEVEYRLSRANGDIIWVRDSGRVERDTVRHSLIIYGLVSDITKRKQAEATLALVHNQALEASRLKTELLAKVSHELRTPLGAILGFAEMLEVDLYGPLSDKKRQMTAKIIDSTQYLTSLVNELLDQAQLEAGRLKLNIRPFSPADLVNNTLAKMNMLAQTKGLTLVADIGPDVPAMLQGDAARLQQILVNLISNAIKFTPAGEVRVCLYCPDAGHWALQVSDTGSGIPAEARTYIFEPFRQVDGSMTRVQAGTGLGLSIVKQLTTLMRGEITLESEVGQGSTFTISLPLEPIQEQIA